MFVPPITRKKGAHANEGKGLRSDRKAGDHGLDNIAKR